MSHLLHRLEAVVLAGAVAITVSGSAASASSAPQSRTAAYVCGRGLESPPCEVKPSQLEFSDNHDLIATGLAWSGWGRRSTTARADITVNWTGTARTHRGVVKLYDLRPCHGQRAYRAGRVTWASESVVIRFDCRAIPGMPRSVEFHSADGSLGCGMLWDAKEGSSARCDVENAGYQTPLTADCQDLDQGDSLALGEKVVSTCHGDTVLRAGPVLPNGHSRRVGDIRCSMARSGVTCRNLVTGHGFFMSRSSYRVW